MALPIITTNAGRAALVNAANNGTLPIIIASVGVTATAITPLPTTAVLPGEIKRIATIAGDVVADDTIHCMVRDEGSASYTVRSFALYLDDGTLFGVYGQPDPIMEKSAQATLLLALDIKFADVAAAALSFGDTNFLNPPATTDRQGVVELATDAETLAGSDAVRAVTAKGVKAAVAGWIDARFGVGAPSAFVKGLLTSASAAVMRTALGLKAAALKDEGAGNGLDADLLDGKEGAWYTDIVGRLGYTPWGPSNDGAASGLDADLLDGQQGSYYSNIIARLGFTPANKAGDTFTDMITIEKNGSQEIRFSGTGPYRWRAISSALASSGGNFFFQFTNDNFSTNFANSLILTPSGLASSQGQGTFWGASNDGAGSGLDADLLDGLQASAFAKVGAFANFQDIVADRGNGTGAIYFGNTASRYLYWDGANYLLQGAPLIVNGAIAWTLGNDGAGSGLDADLLDGLHASAFLKASDGATFGSNANGYWEKRANGVIEQWGKVTGTFSEAQVSQQFPIAFTDLASVNVQITYIGNGTSWNDMWVQYYTTTLSNFIASFQAPSSGNQGFGFTWRAIGR